MDIGRTYEIPHPFIRATYHAQDEDGPYTLPTWRPGTRKERYESLADGVGHQLLTLVSLHKPGKYPERAFYTRRWRDPDGKCFGKPCLRMCTATKCRRLIAGYAYQFTLTERGEL